jgi:ABC-type dipeptide/oligopeptide/nickel transport system permease component
VVWAWPRAVWRNRWPDHVIPRDLPSLGVSTPSFWLGAVLILVFAVRFRLLRWPGSGSLAFLVLPAVTVALDGIALSRPPGAREPSRGSWPRTTSARPREGTRGRIVVLRTRSSTRDPGRHRAGARVSGRLLGGSVVVESVLRMAGLRPASHQRDPDPRYPLVQSGIFVFATALILVNLRGTVRGGLLDPRVRYR